MYKIVIEPNMTDYNRDSKSKKERFERIYEINCPMVEDALKRCINRAKKYHDNDEISHVYEEEIFLKGNPSIFIPSLCSNYDRIVRENCKDKEIKIRVWEKIPQPVIFPIIKYSLPQQSVNIFAGTGKFHTNTSIGGRGFGNDDMLYREWGSKVKYWNIA